MLIRIFFIIAIFVLSTSSAFSQTQNKSNVKKKIKAEYFIDYKKVNVKEFKKLLATLKEVDHTWYCAETMTGGRTGYDAKDSTGIVYEYVGEIESGKNKSSLTKKLK